MFIKVLLVVIIVVLIFAIFLMKKVITELRQTCKLQGEAMLDLDRRHSKLHRKYQSEVKHREELQKRRIRY